VEQVVISRQTSALHERLPSAPCSRFRATLHAPRVSGQENGIIPNQITTCAEHLKRSLSFFFQSRHTVISRRERGTEESVLPIDIEAEFSNREWYLKSLYATRSEISC